MQKNAIWAEVDSNSLQDTALKIITNKTITTATFQRQVI